MLNFKFFRYHFTLKKGDIYFLFLQLAVVFKMKKKNESKKTSDTKIFSQARRKKTIQQFNNKTNR